MISYDLAKELKDAGFPCPSLQSPSLLFQDDEDIESVFSLSKLIEACVFKGCNFKLYCNDKGFAIGFERGYGLLNNKNEELIGMLVKKTPEEAVAKLWLRLNERETVKQ